MQNQRVARVENMDVSDGFTLAVEYKRLAGVTGVQTLDLVGAEIVKERLSIVASDFDHCTVEANKSRAIF